MKKDKFDLGKMRQNFSGLENFATRHTVETLTIVAIILGAISSWGHFFLGSLGWSILFVVIGSGLGMFLPHQMDTVIKKTYPQGMDRKKTYVIGFEVVKILFALFIPFIYFGFLGVMAGTAYQYYVHNSESGNKSNKAA
jgi:hypothetical protein